MRGGATLPGRDRRRAVTLAVIIVLQSLCAAFFASDIVSDFGNNFDGEGYASLHLQMEAVATAVLIIGVIFLMIELRGVMARMEEMDRGLRAARGEMAQIIDAFFEGWQLTPSEREVALLILKGFDNEEIARLRGTAPGTVRAQSARLYSKAGVDGRAQLFSLFLEELLAGEAGAPRMGTAS
ncbi:helix-turn-helix transcriptional regulator [Roseovarius nanhaiticus]|uniref:helix-turn-helix transcriptional regulator n=1 Tax=Roseovarius nanhaiticus TaxID=573024 RepID=UPI002492C06E|nr:helix-turn-helix transcriptional regulator [Roseovarius nanhaiticus]